MNRSVIQHRLFSSARKMQTALSIRRAVTHSIQWQLNRLVIVIAVCRWPQSRPKPTFRSRQHTWMCHVDWLRNRYAPSTLAAGAGEAGGRATPTRVNNNKKINKKVAINGTWKKWICWQSINIPGLEKSNMDFNEIQIIPSPPFHQISSCAAQRFSIKKSFIKETLQNGRITLKSSFKIIWIVMQFVQVNYLLILYFSFTLAMSINLHQINAASFLINIKRVLTEPKLATAMFHFN